MKIQDIFCDSVGIRTRDPQLRRLLLYPAELRNQPICNLRMQSYKKITGTGTLTGIFLYFS